MPSVNSRLPSLLFEDILAGRGATVDPAGSSPRLEQQTGPAWPPAGIIPELNHVWLNPGAYLEPGTGFGSRGASSAIQNQQFQSQRQLPPFPGFNFMFPPFFFGFGAQGVPQDNPLQQSGGEGGDGIERYIAAALDFLQKVAEGWPSTPSPELNTDPWFEQQFGKEPTYTLTGEETDPVIDTSQFSLGGEPLETLDPVSPSALRADFPNLYTPFEWSPEAATNAFGFPSDPSFSFIDDAAGAPVHGLEGFRFTEPLNVPGIVGPEAAVDLTATSGAAGAAGPSFADIGPNIAAAAATVGAPLLVNELGGTANQAKVAGAGAAMTSAALGLSNPITWPLIPLMLSLPKMLDLGGRERRTATDASDLQGMVQNRQQLLSIAQNNPELLRTILPILNQTDFSRFEEIERNQRLPADSIQAVRAFLQETNPIVQNLGVQPMTQAELLQAPQLRAEAAAKPTKTQTPKASAPKVNLPANLPKLPQLSEGEQWRLQQIAEQRALEDYWRQYTLDNPPPLGDRGR